MAAILGDIDRADRGDLRRRRPTEAGVVVPANYNCPGQIVISGEIAGVERAMELAKDAGAKRAMRLNVSGAFHSPLMEVARGGLARSARHGALRRSALPGLRERERASRCTTRRRATAAARAAHGARALDATRSSASRAAIPDALFVEMGPGNVLDGLVKKIAPALQTRDAAAPPPKSTQLLASWSPR